jgi:hypothetical protein
MDMTKTFCDYVLTQSWSHIKQVFYDYYFLNQKYDYNTKVIDYNHLYYYYMSIISHYSHEF